MKTAPSLLKALFVCFVLIVAATACCKHKNGNDVPDPLAEKKEAQEKYDAAVSLLESGSNYSQALDLLEESAKQGSDSAQVAAGALFEYGLGTKADMSRAKEYYKQAAEQGNREAKEKLRILEISKSQMDLPSGFSTPMNEMMVWNGDTLRVLNGDASFFSSEKNVTVVDKDLRPVYVSFRAMDGKTATEPIRLDAKETAVSLLLLSIPYALTMENDHYQTLLREMLEGFPETGTLAKAIESSVGKNGYLVYDEVKDEMSAAMVRANKELGLDKISKELPETKSSIEDQSAGSMPFSASSAKASTDTPGIVTKAVNQPEIAWGKSFFLGGLKTQLYNEYKDGSKGREWKVTVANELPMYFYLEYGTIAEMGMTGDELKEYRQSQGLSTGFNPACMLKAVNLSKYFDMVGVNGVSKFGEAYTTLLQDATTIVSAWFRGERADYFDKSFGKQMVSVWMPIETDRDVLYICSMDRRPEIFLAGLFDVVVFPLVSQYFSDFGDEIYGPLIASFLENTEVREMIEMAQALRDWHLETFAKLMKNHVTKWLETSFVECMAELVDRGIIRVMTYEALDAAGCIFPALMTEGMTEAIVGELKALFTLAKWGEIAANSAIWALYQLTTDSYSVGFSIQSDGVPDVLEAIDMGLSVKWANCNLGASSQWGDGRLFAWGETREKSSYEWADYMWGRGWDSMTKYNSQDGLTVLEPDDDAVTKAWGGRWRTPTAEEFQELMDNCKFEVRDLWGQRGYMVTSKKTGAYIYLPSAGASDLSATLEGRYWTSSLFEGDPSMARDFDFTTSANTTSYSIREALRRRGLSVRGVQDIERPTLKVSRTYLDFNDTQVGQSSTLDWTITNVGNAKLTVSSFTVPSGFSTDFSSWSSKSLNPNESHTFKVTFKPTEAKDYSGKMVLKSNASNAPEASFTIGGKGVAAAEAKLKVSRTYLEFEDTQVGQSSQLDWTITNVGNAKLTVSSFTVPSGFSTDFSSWSSKSLSPNESHTFKVTFKPTEAKDYSGKMVLKSNASNAPEASFTIGGKGVESSKVLLGWDPMEMDFHDVAVGKTSQRDWKITNLGNARMEVYDIVSPDGFSTNFSGWSKRYLEPGESHTFQVSFTPSQAKVYSGKIIFKSNTTGYPEAYFNVRGEGYIEDHSQAIVEASATKVNFGNVNVGETAERSVILKNKGDATLEIRSIHCVGNFSTNFDSWSSKTIGVNESKTLKIYFTPTEDTYYTGHIAISTNAANVEGGLLYVNFEGTGTAVSQAPAGAVDLGIIFKRADGSTYNLYWAECNLGASNPEDSGDFYAWGETETKEVFSYETYKWSISVGSDWKVTKYCPDGMSSWWAGSGKPDGKTRLVPEDDPARKLGGKWRMPSDSEWREMLGHCYKKWITKNGVKGFELTGPNGKSIFLPVTDCYSVYGPMSAEDHINCIGAYWSSDLFFDDSLPYPFFTASFVIMYEKDDAEPHLAGWIGDRSYGQSIRPVSE